MPFELSATELAIGALFFVLSTVATTAAVSAFFVWIQPDHFVAKQRGLIRVQSRLARTLIAIGRNAAGVSLVLIGILLSLPGVPGQGLLTVLVGLLLLDIPGKRRLELALVRRPAVLGTINQLRRRFAKEPLSVEVEPPESGRDMALGGKESGSEERRSDVAEP